jgi:hypothetical protein
MGSRHWKDRLWCHFGCQECSPQALLAFLVLTSLAVLTAKFLESFVLTRARTPVLLTFLTAKPKFAYELWEWLSSQSVDDIRRSIDFLFPIYSGSHRNVMYWRHPNRSDFPNWASDLLWGSEEAQRHFFAHQNPLNCATQKFLKISGLGGWNGICSETHNAAQWFAHAFSMKRIVVWDTKLDRTWTNGPECKGIRSYDCFFAPITNCSANRNVVVSSEIAGKPKLPSWEIDLVRDSPVDPRAIGWHWFAQCFSYIFQPNEWMIGQIFKKMDEAHVPRSKLSAGGFDVAVHIRHGDKWDEMTLIDDSHYVNVLMLIKKMLNRSISVFLMTDDEDSVTHFHQIPGIDVWHLNYPYRQYNSQEELRTLGTKAVLYVIADIWIACHANMHIGTFQSNVDRAIIELKGTSFPAASMLSFEMERKCVSAAHCRAIGHVIDYHSSGFKDCGVGETGGI